MNLETIFRGLCLGLYAAESLIALLMQMGQSGGRLSNRGSHLLLFVFIIAVLRGSDWVRWIASWRIFPAYHWLKPVSLVVLIVGIAIRAPAFVTRGGVFSINAAIRDVQQLQWNGIYRLFRYPPYLGIEVTLCAIGLNSGHWARLESTFLPRTVGLLYRILVEEQTLRGALAEEYAPYWKTTKRMISRLVVFVICTLVFGSRGVSAQDHVGNVLKGEAKVEILHRYEGAEMLPKPERVVIQDFANNGAFVDDERSSPHRESDSGTMPDDLVQQLQKSVAKTLIGQFKKMKVESERVSDAGAVVGPALIVQGEFTSIAPGNSRKRIIVGFGLGASDLRTHVIISEVVGGQRTVLLECNIDSRSGRQPGAILTTSGTGFAIGVATGHFGDKLSSTVQADAARMAKLVGKQTKAMMAAQQWIASHPPIRSAPCLLGERKVGK